MPTYLTRGCSERPPSHLSLCSPSFSFGSRPPPSQSAIPLDCPSHPMVPLLPPVSTHSASLCNWRTSRPHPPPHRRSPAEHTARTGCLYVPRSRPSTGYPPVIVLPSLHVPFFLMLWAATTALAFTRRIFLLPPLPQPRSRRCHPPPLPTTLAPLSLQPQILLPL